MFYILISHTFQTVVPDLRTRCIFNVVFLEHLGEESTLPPFFLICEVSKIKTFKLLQRRDALFYK